MKHTASKIVTTTVADAIEAEKLASLVTETNLAACVQFWPIRSIYRWKGRIESASEHLLVCKTRADRAATLVAFISQHHTYEVPEVVVTSIEDGNPAYLAWICHETTQPRLTFRASATRKRSSRRGGKS